MKDKKNKLGPKKKKKKNRFRVKMEVKDDLIVELYEVTEE